MAKVSGMAGTALSGLQKQVLSLYRRCIRESAKKGPARDIFRHFSRSEFNRYKLLNKRDFTTIEHLLRLGTKRVDTMANPNVKSVHI